jgi:hypothetical protein
MATLEHALLPYDFYLRVRLVCQRYIKPRGSRFRFRLVCGKNSARIPLNYKEASRWGKVRKNFRLRKDAFTVLWPT